jgi:hypothetical protein
LRRALLLALTGFPVLLSACLHRTATPDTKIPRGLEMLYDAPAAASSGEQPREPASAAEPEPAVHDTSQESEVIERQANQFFFNNPALRDRPLCVARVLNKRTDALRSRGLDPVPSATKWDRKLAAASYAACFPQKPWVRVANGDHGRGVYLDPTRIEIRRNNQVMFWMLGEVFDESVDFFITRELADCDRRVEATLDGASMAAGRYQLQQHDQGEGSETIDWSSPLPGSWGEEVLNAACRYRAAAVMRMAPRPKSRE